MMSTEPRAQASRRRDESISVALATAICVLALVYTFTAQTTVLVAWELLALTYLLFVFARLRNRATRGVPLAERALSGRLLEYLSWAVPIAASGTGVTSAVVLLTMQGPGRPGALSGPAVGALGAAGVVVAWALLQTGFAEIYESVYERLPDPTMLSFPGGNGQPILSDFLYLAFTVGTSFAVSGVSIASRKVRRVVLLHSVTSFFYNAVLIAIAIQVVQSIIAAT